VRAREVAEVLVRLAREGRALVVASHDSRVACAPGVSTVLDLAVGRLVPEAPEESRGQASSSSARGT
jgi:ABC-type ATPase involved in cell division